ncbi:hypothetical protein RA210_U10377 [Rubrivivax sp. A210]|nr:hypothetical protein RA210_U10377 [Rubrivivax sp. A210]
MGPRSRGQSIWSGWAAGRRRRAGCGHPCRRAIHQCLRAASSCRRHLCCSEPRKSVSLLPPIRETRCVEVQEALATPSKNSRIPQDIRCLCGARMHMHASPCTPMAPRPGLEPGTYGLTVLELYRLWFTGHFAVTT